TDHASQDSTNERKHSNGADAWAERGVHQMIGRRSVRGHLAQPKRTNGVGGCRRLGRLVVDTEQVGARHRTCISSCVILSFSSAIDTTGKFLTNRRKSRKNKAKEPAVMPAPTHVG